MDNNEKDAAWFLGALMFGSMLVVAVIAIFLAALFN